MGFPGGSDGKESACNAGDQEGLNPCVGKILRRRKWLPTPVFLPENSVDRGVWWVYSPLSHRESDTTEGLPLSYSNMEHSLRCNVKQDSKTLKHVYTILTCVCVFTCVL